MTVTDEMIAAYADGELSGEDKARVEAAIAADPALADLVAKHRALKDTLGAHFAPVLDQPVPESLATMLQPKEKETSGGDADVVSFAAERQKRGLAPMARRWAPIAGPALAASLVLALWQPWQGNGAREGYAGTQLAAALDTQLVAEQSVDAETRILLSFENADGQYCRAFRGADAGGIACRDDTGWKIERELGLDGAQSTDYRQAGSETELMIAVQEMAAGGALDAAAEVEAKEKGWR
ncbi:zf-HC2 domain-containing protein [Parerythrobacter aestuarii]|uniref:zf-HC2 domain-containing protein n=1 Tax=Parerythrobacter aestuarii TaxID=3020909 RepID=UPI0024DEBD6C|nr:zf-HC2 domain-containing protein [Parerythrobacter aestuarii]